MSHRIVPLERDLRVLAVGSFANRFGAGAVMTTSALYFTRQVGFSAAEVALALSVAAIVGIVVQVSAGQLGDTRGPRRVLTLCMTGAGVLFKAYLRAYVSVFVLNAVFTGFAAWNSRRLPELPPYLRTAGEPRMAVLRD
ncbi:MAG: hypothetical protein LH477_00915 [Nocardioides sp.]|nr:hypothetical protein [Nocardioides sp.]